MTTKTPGFNVRLRIRFSTDKRGRRIAHRWSPGGLRWLPVPLLDAELWVASDLADAA